MRKEIAFIDGPTDFSLVQGGPLFQLLVRTRLLKPPIELLARRIVVILLVAWLPLLVLSIFSGHALGGTGIPFLLDLGVHTRLLMSVPLLLAAEVLIHHWGKQIVRQFCDRDLVAPEDQPRFESIIASAMRLRNSALMEVLVLALAILGGYALGGRYLEMDTATWYRAASAHQMSLTPAGYWYLIVSLTIFRFILFRWYYRLVVWYRFLWQVARHIPLRLNALHPDRAGGLAFLSLSAYALQPLLLAHTVALSGFLGSKIWHEGATLPQFKLEIAAWIAFLMLLALMPLLFFVIQLGNAKRAGLREYGLVASRYVTEFRRKWIEGRAVPAEALIGSADIQSLADLSSSFAVVAEMRLMPFGRWAVLRLAIVTALPLLPLVLTMIPLGELIDRAMGVLF
jgi:hypothetical protein